MKATGIVRKIDDLGRIVIPKEIRKNMHIKEGDPLEIFIETKGEVVLKKYAPMGNMLELATDLASSLSNLTSMYILISDMENIIAEGSQKNRDYLSKQISDEVIEVINNRKTFTNNTHSKIPIVLGESRIVYTSQFIVPIISDSDVIGSVIILSFDEKNISDVDKALVTFAAEILSKQIS